MKSKNHFLFDLMNNLLLGVSQLAENVPMGGQNHIEMVCNFYVERMFNDYKNNFNPDSEKAIDLCRAWIELMNNEGFLDKKDYQLSNGEDLVNISVNKPNCSYFEYCTTAKEENLPLVCPRMLSCRWIVNKFTGRQYQLMKVESSDPNWCQGTIYPGEIINEILSKDGDNISIAGERAIVLSTNAYGILVKTIYEYAPHILDRVLYESTYYSSLVEYDKIKGYYNSHREIIEHLLNMIGRLGNIRYEIIEFDDLNKRAVIRGYGSYMAEIFKDNKLSKSPKASCASGKG
ncbi:MAG: hypothetical protein PHZ03_03945, partial [Syntrophomonas sp.]|nr:hypothetical protein [Syntrophomonas sp.]